MTRRPTRLRRRTVQGLLDGIHDGSPTADLFAALQAPASGDELSRERMAVAALLAAGAEPVAAVPARRESMLKTTLAKLVATKLIAITAVFGAAGGGVALAAATDHLPAPVQNAAHDAFGAPAAAHGRSAAEHSPSASHATASTTRTTGPGESKPAASPNPSLPGLCRAWQAGATDNSGKAVHNPAFTALVTAAGGVDKVDAYCAGLSRPHPTTTPPPSTATTHPTYPAHPTHSTRPDNQHTKTQDHTHPGPCGCP